MTDKLVEYRLRIRSADNLSDALEVTSVRGGTNPYISEVPAGDGASYDPISGIVTSGSFSVRIVDPITSGTSRLVTAQLEDANARQQLGHRRAFLEFREDGGVWQTLYAGRLTQYRLVSDVEWELRVGDYMQAEHEYTVFDQKADKTQADGLELFATYLTRWPKRGCLFGGPIRNGFLHVPDLNGWEFRVGAQGTEPGYPWTRFDYLSGYDATGHPLPRNVARMEEQRRTINSAVEKFWRPSWQNSPVGEFPDLRVIVNGTAYQPSARITGDSIAVKRPHELLGKALLTPANQLTDMSFWVPGTVGSVGDKVRVHLITRTPTEESPIYYTGHPVDLLTALWTEAGLPYNASSAATVKDAIGRGTRLSLRITAPQALGTFLEQAIYGPWGIGVRSDSSAGTSGQLEPFSGRILISSSVPAVTVTSADVAEDATEAFDLDASEAVRNVVVEHTRFTQPTLLNVLGQPYPDPEAAMALVDTTERLELANDDPDAIGTGEVSYVIPGMVHFSLAATVHEHMNVRSWADGRALEIFDRLGRGPIRLRTTILRTSAAMSAKLGAEILVNLPQLPNKNKRLLDDGTVPARAMQIVHLTPTLIGHEIECMDSGPNANAIATLPVLSIARSTGSPRNIAEVTVTNAATLNASALACRIQIAVTTGAAPAAEDYTDVLFFRAGQVPTTATKLPPASPGSTVYLRARSEKRIERPSSWSAPVNVALDPLNAPTALTATPNPSDGSKADLAWTNGASSGTPLTEVWLRLSVDAFSAAVLKDVLPASSTFYRLEGLIPGTSYTASVRHLDEVTSAYSALTEVTFTASATTVTLGAPVSPDGFSLPISAVTERVMQRRVGVTGARYGIVVVATEFPSDVVIEEAVETGVGTGVYGAYAGVGRVGSVSGDWTIWSRTAPNDRLRRKLRAQHAREGATSSAYTSEVVVDPTTNDPIAPYMAVHGSLTLKQDGTSVLQLDGSANVNSYRYATSTSAYPSDATAAAGTAVNGRAIADVAIAFLDYGERVYITVVPFTGANGTGIAGASLRLTITRVGGTDIPQGTVAIAASGAASFSFEGPTWAGSYRYNVSTSAFPNDATTASSGTILNGRVQANVASGITLTLGQTIYITIVPFRATAAGGYQGGAIHLTATRHDFSATRTVSFGPAALTPVDSFSSTRYDFSSATGYLRSVNHGGNSASTYLATDLIVPDGCTITGLSINAYADNGRFFPPDLSFAVTSLSLLRCATDGTTTAIASASVSNVAGWNTATNSSISELTTGRQYRLYITLNPTGTTTTAPADGACRVATYSYTYTMPSSDKSL